MKPNKMTPSERLARIKAVQEAAARQAEQEAGHSSSIVPQLQEAARRISARLDALDLQLLHNMGVTAAQFAELRSIEKDYEDAKMDGDWIP
jgi:hypothetical protein